MSVSEILFVVAGALLGLAFQGGMFLFLIPFAVVAFSLAVMNRPNSPNTSVIPVIKRDKRSTALTPVVSPDIRNEFTNDVKLETNEPNSSLRVNQIWSRANSDVDKTFGDILRCLRLLMPDANTFTIFTNGGSPNEFRLRAFQSDVQNFIDSSAKITENTGILSQLLRPGVSRILEGDLLVSKRLPYYIENRRIRSLIGVPLLDRDERRLGAILVDSLRPNAFKEPEAQAQDENIGRATVRLLGLAKIVEDPFDLRRCERALMTGVAKILQSFQQVGTMLCPLPELSPCGSGSVLRAIHHGEFRASVCPSLHFCFCLCLFNHALLCLLVLRVVVDNSLRSYPSFEMFLICQCVWL